MEGGMTKYTQVHRVSRAECLAASPFDRELIAVMINSIRLSKASRRPPPVCAVPVKKPTEY